MVFTLVIFGLSSHPGFIYGIEASIILIIIQRLVQSGRHMVRLSQICASEAPAQSSGCTLHHTVHRVVQGDHELLPFPPSLLLRLLLSSFLRLAGGGVCVPSSRRCLRLAVRFLSSSLAIVIIIGSVLLSTVLISVRNVRRLLLLFRRVILVFAG